MQSSKFRNFYPLILYICGSLFFLWSFRFTLPKNLSIWFVWILLNFFSRLFHFEIKIKTLRLGISLVGTTLLASFFLFGLPFTLGTNAIGTLLFYLAKRQSLFLCGLTVAVNTIAFSSAVLIFEAFRLHAFPFAVRIFLFSLFLNIFSALLQDLWDALEGKIPFKKILITEIHEQLPANLMNIVFYPMQAWLLILLWPSYPWAVAFLGVPFYGLKLVMDNIRKTQEELEKAIHAMSNVLEAKDDYTERHTDRVSEYAKVIAKSYGLDDRVIEKISRIAKIHDVGKVLVSDDVLQKPDKLTKEEYEHIKLHVRYDLAAGFVPPQFPIYGLLQTARLHHERYDGKGYPFGLKGEEIPIEARVISVADAWDAMTTTRVYRANLPEERALNILKINAGTQWDPKVVEAFFKAYETRAIQAIPFL